MSETLYNGPVVLSAHAGPGGLQRVQVTILSGSDHESLRPDEALELALHLVLWLVDRKSRVGAPAAALAEFAGLSLDNILATALLSAEGGCRVRMLRERHDAWTLGEVLDRFGMVLGSTWAGAYLDARSPDARSPRCLMPMAPVVVAFVELLADMSLLTGGSWSHSFDVSTGTDSEAGDDAK